MRRWTGAFAAGLVALAAAAGGAQDGASTAPVELKRMDGFHGIWYQNQPSKDEYKFKYSGGFATYPQQHIPLAIYSAAVDRTFFCYGGVEPGSDELLHMVAYFDHATGKVSRSRVLLNKKTSDAHDNPVLAMDDDGYVYVFSPSHGTSRKTFVSKSAEPYSIDAFSTAESFNFSYPQPKFIPGKGFLLLHTRYEGGRSLYISRSGDGFAWEDDRKLARIGQGHYQVSNQRGDGLVATAFNYHPEPGGLNYRTNIYYMESPDAGESWRTAGGRALALPVATTDSLALVHDYEREGLLVYLKDIVFDGAGNPVILYITSRGYASGPQNDPRTWKIARWDGSAWVRSVITTATGGNNYDLGSLYLESDDAWKLIAPTEPGPQPYNPGGEVAVWMSRDKGATWVKTKDLTAGSERNHTFVRRPVGAHEGFYAFWADGHGRKRSESRLFYTDREGTGVWALPVEMDGEMGSAELVE